MDATFVIGAVALAMGAIALAILGAIGVSIWGLMQRGALAVWRRWRSWRLRRQVIQLTWDDPPAGDVEMKVYTMDEDGNRILAPDTEETRAAAKRGAEARRRAVEGDPPSDQSN